MFRRDFFSYSIGTLLAPAIGWMARKPKHSGTVNPDTLHSICHVCGQPGRFVSAVSQEGFPQRDKSGVWVRRWRLDDMGFACKEHGAFEERALSTEERNRYVESHGGWAPVQHCEDCTEASVL
jgi:hypothetical protein